MTNADKVLDVLTRLKPGAGVCDDCLAAKARSLSKQQVSQICRKLLAEGRIARETGVCSAAKHSSKKLLNSVAAARAQAPKQSKSKTPNIKDQTDLLSQWLFDASKFLDRIDKNPLPQEPFAARTARLKREERMKASLSAVMQLMNTFRVQVVKERAALDDQEWKLAVQGSELCRSQWLKKRI
jgi:hypothetical protein